MKLLTKVLVVCLLFLVAGSAHAQEAFYRGKTVRLVVVSAPVAALMFIAERYPGISVSICPEIQPLLSKT